MSSGLKLLLSFSCCLILANLYTAQPILVDIAQDIGLDLAAGGMIVTMAQIGYCLGVLFLVPLGDLVDNRRLIAGLVLAASAALLMAGASTQATCFLAAMFCIGLFSSAVQVIIPFGAGLARASERGRVVSLIASGAILGIVLSRPAASALTGIFGWRVCYYLPSLLLAVLGVILLTHLPRQQPATTTRTPYPVMLQSMVSMVRHMPTLRHRLVFMALFFSCFTMFWATAPMVLKDVLSFSHAEIALISLASLAAPPCVILAGRLADKGHGTLITLAGVCIAGSAFLLSPLFGISAVIFVLSVILLDSGVHMTNAVMQLGILSLLPDSRSRLNALCIASTFCGGALGSSFGPWVYSHFGWLAVAGIGVAISITALGVQVLLAVLLACEREVGVTPPAPEWVTNRSIK